MPWFVRWDMALKPREHRHLRLREIQAAVGMEPFLHIVNNPAFLSILSTGGILSGDIRFIGDNFAEGPICDTQSAQEWERSRLDFWQRETATFGSNEKDLVYPDLDTRL